MAMVPFFQKLKRVTQLIQQHTFFDLGSNNTNRLLNSGDQDLVLQVYQENSDRVHALAEEYPDRVLIFHVQDGWEPLCKFLGLPIPQKTPFPITNSRFTFRMHFFLLFAGFCILGAVVVGASIWIVRQWTTSKPKLTKNE